MYWRGLASLDEASDGGTTWTRLQGNGLPTHPVGKIGLAIARSNPNRVYALIEQGTPVLYRSDDGGKTWKTLALPADTFLGIPAFAVDPNNPAHVVIGSLTSIWETFNAQNNILPITWTKIATITRGSVSDT